MSMYTQQTNKYNTSIMTREVSLGSSMLLPMFVFLLLQVWLSNAFAFVVPTWQGIDHQRYLHIPKLDIHKLSGRDCFHTSAIFMVANQVHEIDRSTVFSGEPTERAKTLPHRSIVSSSVVYSPTTREAIALDTLLPPITAKSQTSIVVFLRSLG
jgi:hypothetical protein